MLKNIDPLLNADVLYALRLPTEDQHLGTVRDLLTLSYPPLVQAAEQAARSREKENLRLSRQRVVQQIESSQNPRHRKILQDALAELDQRLSQFEK